MGMSFGGIFRQKGPFWGLFGGFHGQIVGHRDDFAFGEKVDIENKMLLKSRLVLKSEISFAC